MLRLRLRLTLILLGIRVLGLQAECNMCSATTNVACVSETQFMFCDNNIPIEPLNYCPYGTYCTADAQICQTESTLKVCNTCSICNAEMTHACLGVRTFSLCLGQVIPSLITGTCAPHYVCNLDNPHICTNSSLGSQASCPLVDDELLSTTTPNGNVDPTVYCKYMQKLGRFPFGNDRTTTCRQYIQCRYSGSDWFGALYQCPGYTYFQSSIQRCNTTIPNYCYDVVNSMQISNLRLL